jgi:hypothetical protein
MGEGIVRPATNRLEAIDCLALIAAAKGNIQRA